MHAELTPVAEWLKNSILGIVLLGAIGSLLAVAILRFVGPPLQKLLLRPLNYLGKERLWRYWRSGAAYAHIESDPTNRLLVFYLVRHLARLVLAVAAFTLTTIIFSVVVASQSAVLLTYGTFVLSMLASLSAYWVWVEYDYITINYIAAWRNTGLVKKPPVLKEADARSARTTAPPDGKDRGA